jgi:Carboxypeptidase regulatory-like domain
MLVLITIWISVLLGQAPAAGTPATVQGTVCEVYSCNPIAGARVALLASPQRTRRTVVTDLTGSFRFPDVPPGKYDIVVEADNYTPASVLPGIDVGNVAGVEALKIEMRALGTISGRAFDEKGAPLAGARVDAMAFRPQSFYRMLMPVARSSTDDRGEFRIAGLDPDEYYIRVSPPFDNLVKDSFPITFYPNTTDPAGAAKIVVEPGAEIAGIDPRLSSRGVKVRGRLVESNSKNVVQAVLMLMPRSPSVFVAPFFGVNQVDQTTDDFELRGVAPGSYYLYASKTRDMNGPEWVRFPVDVGDKDVDNVTIPFVTPGSIKGRITFADDAINTNSVDLSRITLTAGTNEIVPGSPNRSAGAHVGSNGTFEFPHLPEMRLFIKDQTVNDTWFISSVRFDGSDVMSSGFSTMPGKDSSLDVVISNASGTLEGVVRDRQQKPVPAGRIVLLPDLRLRSNPFLIRTGVAVERGEFKIEIIPPGEYTAIALPDEDQFTPAFLRDLTSVESYERFGEHIHIAAGESTRMDLTVAPIETK